jgi:hypothetical protein
MGNFRQISSDLSAQVLKTARDVLKNTLAPVVDSWPDNSLVIQALAVNNTTSAAQQLLWPCDGYLVGISATTEDGLIASQGGSQLRVLVDGKEDLFILNGGSGAAYLTFTMITGIQNGTKFAYRRPFRAQLAWQAYVKTNGNYTVDVAFHYVNTSSQRLA